MFNLWNTVNNFIIKPIPWHYKLTKKFICTFQGRIIFGIGPQKPQPLFVIHKPINFFGSLLFFNLNKLSFILYLLGPTPCPKTSLGWSGCNSVGPTWTRGISVNSIETNSSNKTVVIINTKHERQSETIILGGNSWTCNGPKKSTQCSISPLVSSWSSTEEKLNKNAFCTPFHYKSLWNLAFVNKILHFQSQHIFNL